MAGLQSTYIPILQLPPELLFFLLQLSRPNDFEALMLTCKTIYQVGALLIQEHNFCKTWPVFYESRQLPTFNEPRRLPGYLEFKGLFRFFQCLLEIPASRQSRILQYLSNIEWIGGFYPKPEGDTEIAVLKKMALKAPWLFKRIQAINKNLQRLNVCYSQVLFEEDFEVKDSGPSIAQQGSENVYTDSKASSLMPDLIGLLLLSNLISLKIDDSGSQEFLELVRHLNGELYFQQLRKIYFKGALQKSLNQIAPLLLLPNLKYLIIHNVEDRQPLVDGREAVTFKWPYGNKKSTLENVCFYNSGAETSSLSEFLSPCLFLRSFIWENIGLLEDEQDPPDHLPADDRQSHGEGQPRETPTSEDRPSIENETVNGENDEYRDPDDNPYHPYWEQHWVSLVEYDSDVRSSNGESAEDNSSIKSTVDDGQWFPKDSPIWWNPAKLLKDVLLPQRDTLEHIALTIVSHISCYTLVERSHQVQHFKDFTNLKYLEFDTRVVRTRRGKHNQIPPEGIPASLAAILPSSIEAVRIMVFHPEFSIVHAMLRSLPRERTNFPRLRNLYLVLKANSHRFEFTDTETTVEIKKRLIHLQEDLQKLGVALTFETSEFQWYSPRASIKRY
jgi:hypothetical protein